MAITWVSLFKMLREENRKTNEADIASGATKRLPPELEAILHEFHLSEPRVDATTEHK